MAWREEKLALCVFISLVAPPCLNTVQAADKIVDSRGGSDFSYFDVQGCDFVRFSVLPNYELNKEIINSRLAAMYKNGQRRLRTAIPLPDNSSGTAPGHTLSNELKKNVSEFLAAVKQNNFEAIEIVISSIGLPPFLWKEWHEDLYVRRLQYIAELRPLFIASGLHYYIDLFNGGIPTDNQPIMLRYTQRLWADYTKSFGKEDTIGFSFGTVPRQDRFKQMPLVYGNNPPNTFELHIYDDPYNTFVNAHDRLKALGYGGIPWIIGETFYNDGEEADGFARAIRTTGQPVRFLLQWPLRKTRDCRDIDVVPLDFGEYMRRGF